MIPTNTKPGAKVFHVDENRIEEVIFLGSTDYWVAFTKGTEYCSGAKQENVFFDKKEALARAIQLAYESLNNASKNLAKLTAEMAEEMNASKDCAVARPARQG